MIDKNQGLMNEKFQKICAIIQNKTTDNLSTISVQYRELNEFQLQLYENVDLYKAAFEECCKLLVEFCCFQGQLSVDNQPVFSKGITSIVVFSFELMIALLKKADTSVHLIRLHSGN